TSGHIQPPEGVCRVQPRDPHIAGNLHREILNILAGSGRARFRLFTPGLEQPAVQDRDIHIDPRAAVRLLNPWIANWSHTGGHRRADGWISKLLLSLGKTLNGAPSQL